MGLVYTNGADERVIRPELLETEKALGGPRCTEAGRAGGTAVRLQPDRRASGRTWNPRTRGRARRRGERRRCGAATRHRWDELWQSRGTRTTIDAAGRVVIPRALRDRVGLVPGEVDLEIDGAGIRLEPVATDLVIEKGGRLVIPASGQPIDDDAVQRLRHADER